ncbi:MAG TPA: choice-of-anchor Q domain-containing protein, partial [Clostridia bacterium]|nr:choice-of-anchor Q domain-containing protein [Clostridia bacterium]
MNKCCACLPAVVVLVLQAVASPGAVLFVNINNPSPVLPYSTWATAATNIQDAIDAAAPGDQVLVTDGVYQFGSGLAADGTTNRVAITKPVSVESLNGSAATVINGGKTMRCAYLANGAALSGFSLINGTAVNGGGAYCASTNAQLFDCLVTANAGKYGGGVYSGTLSNCTVSSNSVGFGGSGGGTYDATLVNSTIQGNSTLVNGGSGAGAAGGYLSGCVINENTCNGTGATVGGGVSGAVLTDCTLSGNRVTGAGSGGGGAHASTLNNCTLANNHANHSAGGAYNCVLTNCTLVGNRADYGGGGVSGGTLVNCVLRNNNGGGYGGGVYWTTTLINCTLVGNNAQRGGGGYSCTFYNCIIYFNTGSTGPNTLGCTYSYSCTPDAGGVGNLTSAPLFVNRAAGDLHLLAGTAAIDAGANGYAGTLTDADGNLRIANGTVDMGAYEYQSPNPATVAIECDYTNVVVGITASFKGIFSRGRTVSWDFGDGTVVSNQVFASHSWPVPGDYPVTLTVFDSGNPEGVSGVYVIHVIPPPVSYVNPASANPVPPFSAWETAATSIQDAVDAVIYGAHILVTNGTYQSGGRVAHGALTNRLVIDKPVLVQSVNGPALTAIQGNPAIGDEAVRCVYLTNGARLSGFTLLHGATRAGGDGAREQSGGGAWCASTNDLLLNCVLISNTANVFGGGVRGGSLSNCLLIANAATGSGGGAYLSLMTGCLLSNNTAIIGYGPISGGGASSCTLVQCTLVSNVTHTPNFHPASGGGAVDSTLTDCTLAGNAARDGGAAHNSKLKNCLLSHNTSENAGGGAAVSTLTDCLVISNSAGLGGGCYDSIGTNCVLRHNNSYYHGGGATGGSLYNCLLTGNAATASAGGAAAANIYGVGTMLINCTVAGNSAYYRGGGVDSCTVWNSIVVSNVVVESPDSSNWFGGQLNYSCTAPLPGTGAGNITNAPLFIDLAGGNFQLHPSSACINAGTNAFFPVALDLAGNPRIMAGTVDLGAYECQAPALL